MKQSHTQRTFRSKRTSRNAFIMLEVIIALTILAVTVSMILRSFSQSLSAIRRLEVETQALFFAAQLLDEFEINPPDEGRAEGGFGDDYAEYYFIREVKYDIPRYSGQSSVDKIDQFFPMRYLHIEIHYDNGRNKAFRALSLDSAIMGFERLSAEHKRQMKVYED